MNHSEALQQMAVEQYLLDEMGPDARDAFEEHMFDCTECAMDVRAGVVFIDEAKRQLPWLAAEAKAKPAKEARDWFAWLKPVYMVPAFATLLCVVAYQNIVEVPALQMAVSQPSLVPVTALRGAVRGEHQKLTATAQGVAILVNLQPDEGAASEYASYTVELVNPQGKVAWSTTVAAPREDEPAQQSLTIPRRGLENATYTVKVIGVDAHGARADVRTDVFDLTVRE